MKEIWKDINGFEGYYQISNFNKIRSIDREVVCRGGKTRISKGKIKSLTKRAGYWTVQLCKENKVYSFSMHRLLAVHFIENGDNKKCVNHKNGIKLDNSLSNLEWCTYSENHIHAFKTGLYVPKSGELHPHTFFKEKEVVRIRELYDKYEKKISEIAREYNVSFKTIENIVKRKNWVNL